jgi:hypothetical protein
MPILGGMKVFPWQCIGYMMPLYDGFGIRVGIWFLNKDTIGYTRTSRHIIAMSKHRKTNKPILLFMPRIEHNLN